MSQVTRFSTVIFTKI